MKSNTATHASNSAPGVGSTKYSINLGDSQPSFSPPFLSLVVGMYTSIPLLFLHLAAAIAAPLTASSNYAIKDSLEVPADWTQVGEAPKDHFLHFQIGLKPSDEGALEGQLLEISDPAHPRYKQYLSTEEVAALIAPSNLTQTLVENWLVEQKVEKFMWHEPGRDWISANVTIQMAENMLQTKYFELVHDDSGTRVKRTTDFFLPLHLREHVEVIHPTTSFIQPRSHSARGNVSAVDKRSDFVQVRDENNLPHDCDTMMTPDCIRSLYGFTDVRHCMP